jgi:two-component system, chemotaxis family, CheB/CheR fusion protein
VTQKETAPSFHVVGVGASAGGLEALNHLLRHVTMDSLALVVIQHLAPDRESSLTEILGRSTAVKVVTIEEGTKVEANHVYVAPPAMDIAILHGTLHLMPQSPAPQRLPIDFFFRSLAQDEASRAIGVVLSGTGTDGTFGLKAIKEAGGLTFAQEPSTAKFDGMPRSAIDSGWADVVLGPDAIGEELIRLGQHPYLSRPAHWSHPTQESIAKLMVMIRSRFGNDLTYYKPTMIERRIERRLALHRLERVEDYVTYVASNEDELRRLYKDVLIGVTAFFRDREPYEVLKRTVFPKMIERKELGATIRVWIPACSTGEEAYTVAMTLLEFLGPRSSQFRIQIFATDIDDDSILYARRGLYPENIVLDVSPERLQRFFVKKDNGYQIARHVRDMLVFSNQNVTKDAPLSRLDFVSCRNLLIYLLPMMQKKVLRIFHYALNPDGYLLLGTSETVGDAPELFSLVDGKNKIYVNKRVANVVLDTGFAVTQPEPLLLPRGPGTRPSRGLAQIAEQKVLELYAPPGVIINDTLEVLHFRGRTAPFLEPSPGVASLNILRLARRELHLDLRRVIKDAFEQNARAEVVSKLVDGETLTAVRIEAIPLTEPEGQTRCLLVLFHAVPAPEAAPVASGAAPAVLEHRIQDLERELVVNKDYMQTMVEELESSNEELKTSIEELQSSNEELQSTNEELETSKEELQASNEELTTVNDELQVRMQQQQQANDDLSNVLATVASAVVIVGTDLRIRRYTGVADRLLGLGSQNIGGSIAQLNAFFPKEQLERIGERVISTLQTVEKTIPSSTGDPYVLRVSAYRTGEHAIAGAVYVFTAVPKA